MHERIVWALYGEAGEPMLQRVRRELLLPFEALH